MSMNRGTADAAIGMMDGAYFTGRKDILDFLNNLLQLNLTKIEQTASGAVACQVTEYIFPRSVPLHRVNWEAKTEYEYVQNYKLLQAAFNKHRVQRHIDVDKLIRAKYQDNLEFMQWLKAFFDQAAPPMREGYDPIAARSKGKGGKVAAQRFKQTASQHGSKLLPTDRTAKPSGPSPPTARTAGAPGSSSAQRSGSSRPTSSSGGMRAGPAARIPVSKKENANPSSNRRKPSTRADTPQRSEEAVIAEATLMKKNADLTKRNAELDLTVEGLERERDFYFEKLRDIETMLQIHRESKRGGGGAEELLERVFKVLYATSDQDISVDMETGDLVGRDADVDVERLHDTSADDPSPLKKRSASGSYSVAKTTTLSAKQVLDRSMESVEADDVAAFDEDDDEDLLVDDLH